jgi:hypothetical protein
MPKVKPEEGVAQTVIENDVDGAPKTVNLTSPWGSKVAVAADQADVFKDAGYTGSK